MEYGRLKELAEAFVGRGCVEYPDELEGALHDTARTGIVRLEWNLLCPVLHYRLEKELNMAFSSGSELSEELKEMCRQLLQRLDNFDNPPFTIQRLCELVLQPKKHYKNLDYFMRAIEKNLLVVGTEEPELGWMQSQSLQPPGKPEVRVNGTPHRDTEQPPSPQTVPEPPPAEKNSPPTAPTSTWSNLREGTDEEKDLSANFESGSRGVEMKEGREHSPPMSGLSVRKRGRDSLEQEEDKSSITVRQEADSTVNFEPPPPFDSRDEFQVIDELPSKRQRECPAGVDGGRAEVAGEGDGEERMERESCLSSSSGFGLLVNKKVVPGDVSGGGGEGGGGGGGKENSIVEGEAMIHKNVGSNTDGATPSAIQGVKQVSSECYEAMDTN